MSEKYPFVILRHKATRSPSQVGQEMTKDEAINTACDLYTGGGRASGIAFLVIHADHLDEFLACVFRNVDKILFQAGVY